MKKSKASNFDDGGTSARSQRVNGGACALWSLDCKPIAWDEDTSARPDVILWNGLASVRFHTNRLFYREGRKRYASWHVTFVNGNHKSRRSSFYDWEDFKRYAETEDPYFNLLLKASTLCEDTFRLAKENYGAFIPVCMDIPKYMALCGGETKLQTQQELAKAQQRAEQKSARYHASEALASRIDPLTKERIDD